MSETLIAWFETTFNVTYLALVWGLVWGMYRRRSVVLAEKRPLARLFLWSFFLLAFGDTFHVGFHVLTSAFGLSETVVIGGTPYYWWGIGVLITSITITIFYAMFLIIWQKRFQKPYGWFGYVLFAAAVVRLLLFIPPVNAWNNNVLPQPWSTIRNLPLILQGLGVATLMWRDGRAERDRTFTWISGLIFVSYAFYIPVILFVQHIPALGMLMIPKTTAYVVMGFVVYFHFYSQQSSAGSLVTSD